MTEDFPLLFNFINKIQEKLHKINPKLKEKFEKANINEFLWFSKWFQTLFTYHNDMYISVRIWDFIIVKGIDCIIDISLIIINFLSEEIMRANEIEEIVRVIESIYIVNEKTMKMLKTIEMELDNF